MVEKLVNQAYEMVPVSDLSPHPDNPRRGNVDLIAESIEANGFYGGLVVQRSTGHVLAGNHRFRAAQQVGIEEVPVMWVEVDDDVARRILLVDNRSADLAANDDTELLALLESLDFELEGTGYSPDDLDDLKALLGKIEETAAEETGARFADDGEVVEGVKTLKGVGVMREVLLYLSPEDHAAFVPMVRALQLSYGTTSIVQTLLEAVRREAALTAEA